jgi:hypothetical protein
MRRHLTISDRVRDFPEGVPPGRLAMKRATDPRQLEFKFERHTGKEVIS